MPQVAKFKASQHEFVRDTYLTSKDRHKLSKEELEEVLSYKDIKEDFDYNDWYGSTTRIVVTLKSVEMNQYNDLIFTLESNRSIPAHYFPSPSQVLKNKKLLFPVSYQQLNQ